MIERFHLVATALALGAGLVVALADLRWRERFSPRAVAGAGAAAACVVLVVHPTSRAVPWGVASVVALAIADRERSAHPLGRWVLPMAVLSLAGVWVSVPDTEAPAVAGAAVLPIAVLRAARRRSTGPSATAALVVAVLGVVWVGSAGWGAALAEGALVAQVLVAPAALGFARLPRPIAATRWLVVAHVAVVCALPRAIMSQPVPVALGGAAAAMLASAAVAAHVRSRWP